MATNSTKTTKTNTTTNGTKPEGTEAKTETDMPSISADILRGRSASYRAESDAFRDAQIYLETYDKVFDALTTHGLTNLLRERVTTSRQNNDRFNPSQYVPDTEQINREMAEFSRQLAPQSTVVGLLPGQF